MTGRTVTVEYMARVEGEGALTLRYRDGVVDDVQLRIFEPPRLFEALLVGRSALEAPDVTSRICGICPVAYQLTACQAMEAALGVEVPPEITRLRRLLYCGEWIESHALHMAMLHAPDFLGVHDVVALARLAPEVVAAALRVKKAGNAIVKVLGGREIHPINARVGGFWSLPRRAALDALRADLLAARADALALARFTGTLRLPELRRDYTFVALAPAVYPFLEPPIALGANGPRVAPAEWHAHVIEEHAPYSNALQARLHGEPYLTGPLARFSLNHDRLPAAHRALAAELDLRPPLTNPFASIRVRAVETVFALDEAVALLDGLVLPREPSVPVTLRAGEGAGATEAPRGLLVHRYALDDDGRIAKADIVPPTAQNQLSIEGDLRALGAEIGALDDDGAGVLASFAVRNHDPCISCATHFLRVRREWT